MPTVDKSILNSKLNQGKSYLDELAFAVCINGESIQKYKKIVEKKYGAYVFSNMVQFADTLRQQIKRRQFTNTSLLSLKLLGKNAGLSNMAVDMIVDHLRDKFREEQLKEEMRKHEDTAFWKQCNPNNKNQLQEYLKKYPTGLFSTRAVSLIADLERIEKKAIEESRVFNQCTTQRDYMNYLGKYPNGIYSVKAKSIIGELIKKETEESRIYNLCKCKSNYLEYLRKYPNGKYVKEAQKKINAFENADRQADEDVSFWNQCTPQTKQNLQKYLNEYPNGRYAIQAKSKIAEIERTERKAIEDNRMFNQCRTRNDYKNYLHKYPTGQYVKKANEKIKEFDSEFRGEEDMHVSELDLYKQCKTRDDFLQYLSLYPNGMYVDQACSRIASLEKKHTESRCDNKNNNHSYRVDLKKTKKRKLSIGKISTILVSAIFLYAVAHLIRGECEMLGPILFLVSLFLYMLFAFEVVSDKRIGVAICITGWFVMMFLWSNYAMLSFPTLVILVICSFGSILAYLYFIYHRYT